MNDKIDVLAVIRARCPDHVGAAIAELINKGETALKVLENAIAAGEISVRYGEYISEFRAALARVVSP